MFERDVVLKKEDIAEAERTQPRGNRVVKSTEQSVDDKDHGSVNKTIALVRYNKNSGRRECSDSHLGNRRNNQYGPKRYNLRSRGHTNHDVDLLIMMLM